MGLGEHPYRLGPSVLSFWSLTDKIDNNNNIIIISTLFKLNLNLAWLKIIKDK